MSTRATACILYIDDNSDGRRLMELVLGEAGYVVLTAADGRTGLALAAARRPALILTDMHLPDMDGLAVVTRLRAMPELIGTKVVVLTASAPHEREHALAAGCDAFLEKPLDVDSFLKQVAEWLGQ